MACLFPGAASLEQFWQNLVAGRDCTSLATVEQMGIEPDLLYDPVKGQRDRYYALRGGFVRNPPPLVSTGLNLPPTVLADLDKLEAWTLMVMRQALVDGGRLGDAAALARCGLILGNLSFPTHASHRLLAPIYRRAVEASLTELAGRPVQLDPGPFDGTGTARAVQIASGPAALAAHAFGLGAGWLALDAACASSLYAIKLACERLRTGQADLMLAGAVSAADSLFIHMGFSIFQAYPEPGATSRPLDRASRGLTSGEGAGALLLKRHRDALRDGDRIYGLIRGVGWSNDGAGRHVLVPNPKGQQLAYERAYAEAGLAPERTAYIECHATGTPVGDVTELQTIERFFAAHGHVPLFGSVKSNFGHLLTAAGMAGVIKVVLSMAHGIIPPTIGISDPLTTPSGAVGPQQLVQTSRPWPAERPDQAAVSAFGFGGTNAHLVLERPAAPQAATFIAPPLYSPPPLAIVGMGACFGPWSSLATLEQAIVAGAQALGPLPATRWKGLEAQGAVLRTYGLPEGQAPRGGYLDQFSIDSLRYKIPPAAGDQPIPQQLLILKVADEALRDAGLRPGSHVAVLVAMEAELAVHQFRARVDLSWQLPQALAQAGIVLAPADAARLEEVLKAALNDPAQVNQYTSFIGNLMACRIAALWDFSGPAFTLSAGDGGVFEALQLAQNLLADETLEAVVVGAVDLAGGIERVLAHSLNQPPATGGVGHGCETASWLVGEGAGAVVLRRSAAAVHAGQRVYATLDGLCVTTSSPGEAPSATLARTARTALAAAGASPEQIGALELWASGVPAEDQLELTGLAQVYVAADSGVLSCAAGSVKANLGHAQAAAGMAGLIRMALSLWGRLQPGVPGWSIPRDPAGWAATCFYLPAETRPWFTPRGVRRRAGLNALTADGVYAHAILGEGTPAAPAASLDLHIRRPLPALLPIVAADGAALTARLDELEAALSAGTALHELADRAIRSWHEQRGTAQTVALVAASPVELRRELALVRQGLGPAFAAGRAWETPGGSYATPQPLGAQGELALVFPGAFTSYPGQGRELLTAFPALHNVLERVVALPGMAFAEHLIHLRGQQRPTQADLDCQKLALRGAATALISAGMSFATCATALLREGFGLRPAAALGYSMGEATMLWALGLWHDGDDGMRRLAHSPIFTRNLTGPRTTARAYFGLPTTAPDDFWHVYVVRAPLALVRERLRNERRVFLTHINTADEVVLAGLADDLPAVLADLGGQAFRAPFDAVMHCPPVEAEFEGLRAMHHMPVAGRSHPRLYSSAVYGPVEVDSDGIAQNMARAVCAPVDFPRLIERAYADGARIFLEIGPGNSCTRWIGENLAGRPHMALALSRRGADESLSLVQLLARLTAHQVPLELALLLTSAPPPAKPVRTLLRPIVVGGTPLGDMIVTDAHRRMLAAAQLVEPIVSNEQSPTPAPTTLVDAPLAVMPPEGPPPTDYVALLIARQEQLRQLAESARQALLPATPQLPSAPPPPIPSPAPATPLIWDEAALLEFAQGSIARVFGPEYAPIDHYERRVRLPMPPYLLVSRVTRLDAERGVYRPSTITTEYDIPTDAWYCVDGQAPWAISVESGQCDLLLISYLGIDFQCRGERVYRLLDCTLTFLDDLPQAGDTLRYDISINSFARNGDTLLFFFSYECFIGERMVLRMDGGCAGFFTDGELAGGRGVIDTEAELATRRAAIAQRFAAPLSSARTALAYDDLLRLSAGDLVGCFGPAYGQHGRNPSLRLPPPAMLMIDRVTSIDPHGGAWGLGLVVAEKDLHPTHWYFPCHFKDDQVLAGSLMAEGCGQLLQSYMLSLGLQTCTTDAQFQPIAGLPQVVRCRGQVTPADSRLIYRMEITGLGMEPEPFARANVDIIVEGRIVVRFSDLGLQLREKAPALRPPTPVALLQDEPVLCNEAQIREFATGSLVACFGPAYAHYEGRRAPRTPNGDLQLISRINRVEGQRGAPQPGAQLLSSYDVPANPWFCRENSYPETPYSVLMELGLQPCGFLSAWLGSTLPYPDHDFYFRNLDGSGQLLRPVDLRGKTVVDHVVLRASTAIDGVIIQKFDYRLSCDGEPFFAGEAAFGYFTREALANQVGLDSGRTIQPWLATPHGLPVTTLNLADPQHPLYHAGPGRMHARLPQGHFHLLDRVDLVAGGGRHGQGYAYAMRAVDPQDWFFSCHFFQDPVMPGSLGVEALLRALQALALSEGLGRTLRSPRLALPAGPRCVWKYRGQIPAPSTPTTMGLEIHITRREQHDDHWLLLAEGSLWRDNLRIYEVKDLALAVVEANR